MYKLALYHSLLVFKIIRNLKQSKIIVKNSALLHFRIISLSFVNIVLPHSPNSYKPWDYAQTKAKLTGGAYEEGPYLNL